MGKRVLIACEFSGIVRDEFVKLGHHAVSVDLLTTERPGSHIIARVEDIISDKFDLMIAFPPCTYLARSGARWHSGTQNQRDALNFVRLLLDAPIHQIALENPIGAISSHIRRPDQIIQPWAYGHGETKATCLWLKNLLPLRPTRYVTGRRARVHYEPPGPDRWKNRSRTLVGIARAMAEQWG